MQVSYDLILKGGTVVNHEGIGIRDIGIKDGKILFIGASSQALAAQTLDCRGLHILPGVIDSQVHFREPGLEHKETMESGSRAAVLGGVTTVFEMPNTVPPTTSLSSLEDKFFRAKGRMHCDFAFWVGGTHENIDNIQDLETLPGVAGIKIFIGSSTGALLVEDDEGIFSIFQKARRRVALHAEDEFRLRARCSKKILGDPSSHTVWRDEMTALQATQRAVALACKKKTKIHILHVSTEQELAFLATQKDLVSCEVTPHHLSLVEDDYAKLGSLMQMNPPIRSARHQKALWQGVLNGMIDVLGSDHAPHTLEEKKKPYPNSPSGIPGVQTLVPIMLDHIHSGKLSIQRFVKLTSSMPREIFGLSSKGCVSLGFDADFTIVDLKRRQIISNDMQASFSSWTPYDGRVVNGWPIGSIVRGNIVMWDGDLLSSGKGMPAKFS